MVLETLFVEIENILYEIDVKKIDNKIYNYLVEEYGLDDKTFRIHIIDNIVLGKSSTVSDVKLKHPGVRSVTLYSQRLNKTIATDNLVANSSNTIDEFGNMKLNVKIPEISKLPIFKYGDDPYEFIRSLESVLKSYAINDNLKYLYLMRSCNSTKMVSDMIESMIYDSNNKILNWNFIKTIFLEKFTLTKHDTSKRNTHYSSKMGEKEDFHEYSYTYKYRCIDLNINIREKLCIDHFISSLNMRIRKLWISFKSNFKIQAKLLNVTTFDLATLDTDLDVVIDVISTLIEDGDYSLGLSLSDRKSNLDLKCIHHPGSNSHSTSECRKSKTTTTDKLSSEKSNSAATDLESKVATTTESSSGSSSIMNKPTTADYICKNCHVSGHYFKDCPQIQCTGCHKFGHIQRNCPDKEVKSTYSFRSRNGTTPTSELNCLVSDESDSLLDLDKWYNSFDLMKINYVKEGGNQPQHIYNEYIISISINNVNFLTLLDTGADRSYVDSKLVAEQDWEVSNYSENILLAGNTRLSINKKLKAEVQYNNEIFVHDFGVIDLESKYGYRFIFGRDIISKYRILEVSKISLNHTLKTKTLPFIDTLDDDKTDSVMDEKIIAKIEAGIKDLILENSELVGLSNLNPVQIHIQQDKLINLFKRQYEIPSKYVDKIRVILNKWLNAGIISICNDRFRINVPLLAVPKGVDDVRPVLDFRHINDAMDPLLQDSFTIPNIWDSIHSKFRNCCLFSELDLSNAFLQLPLDENSKKFTKFTFDGISYNFNSTPFGLNFISNTFQRRMIELFGDLPNVLIYVDNLIIYTNDNLDYHIKTLRNVIEILNSKNLKLNVEKIKLGLSSICILGHRITPEGITIDESRVSSILNIPNPKNKKDLISFLGMLNYLNSFIQDLAIITEPLRNITKNDSEFIWDNVTQECFDKAKQAVAKKVLLNFPKENGEFVITTDASRMGISAILSQKLVGEDREILIEFYSRGLRGSEVSYSVYRLELLAIVCGLKKFSKYISGSNFLIRTDHRPLTHLLTQPLSSLNTTLSGWLDYILCYKFEIIHVEGVNNTLADFFSRFCYVEDKIDSIQNQNNLSYQESSNESSESAELFNIQVNKFNFDILTQVNFSNLGTTEQKEILQSLHNTDHASVDQMRKYLSIYNNIKLNKSLMDMIHNIVFCCDICLKNNIAKHSFHPLRSTSSIFPMDLINMDLAEFGLSFFGNKYLLVIIDIATHFIWLRPLPNKSSESILFALKEIFYNFGFTRSIKMDNEISLNSKLIYDFCKANDIQIINSIEYNSMSNSDVERTIRTIRNFVKKIILSNMGSWDVEIYFIQHIYNRNINHIGFNPYYLFFLRCTNDVFQLKEKTNDLFNDWFKKLGDGQLEVDQWLVISASNRKFLYDYVVNIIKDQKSKQNKYFEMKHRIQEQFLPIGTIIYIKDQNIVSKSDSLYQGPYVIVDVVSEKFYKVVDACGDELGRLIPLQDIKMTDLKHIEKEFAIQKIIKKVDQNKFLVRWKSSIISKAEYEEYRLDIKNIIRTIGDKSFVVEWKDSVITSQDFVDKKMLKEFIQSQ